MNSSKYNDLMNSMTKTKTTTTTGSNKYHKYNYGGLEPIYLLYDQRMLLHRPPGWIEPDVFPDDPDECDDDYPMENPERLRVIYRRLCDLEYRLGYEYFAVDEDPFDPMAATNAAHALSKPAIFKRLQCQMATKEQILLAHSEAQYERLNKLEFMTNQEIAELSLQQSQDIYYCQESFKAARLAAGGLLSCVDAVLDATTSTTPSSSTSTAARKTNKAVALVRPPGHHACQSREMGFCFIDSVVVAAKYALQKYKKRVQKIAILDWDIHDGNGTSEATINNPDIFRIDIHRYNAKEGFYPYTGAPNDIGAGNARGLNLNMAWSHGGMGNMEYAAAFYELILPLLAEYQPDLLIISCGLDAAMGDLLGGCELTPDFFHAMTRATLEVVGLNTPVVCALEGGYTMSVIPDCMEAVTLAMLNLPYKYHSSLQLDSFLLGGGAAQEVTPWSTNWLERSRRVLSKYYIRDDGYGYCSHKLIPSAIYDINTCIRIFKGVTRWNNVHLKRLKGPPKPAPVQKKRKQHQSQDDSGDQNSVDGTNSSYISPFQRPRIYLWYGTEVHHQKVW